MWLLWTVTLLSAAILGFEVSLLRILLLASWHHFAFVVISIALLGFGVSGTVLTFLRSRLLSRGETAVYALTLLAGLSMPILSTLAQHVPIEARFVPLLFWQQVSYWVLYWALLLVPFLLGASAIGLALMVAGDRLSLAYGANLVGSGAGAVLAPIAMLYLAPAWLPVVWGLLALTGAAGAAGVRSSVRFTILGVSVFVLAGWIGLDPPRVRIDPFKELARLHRLENQGTAERIATARGPRGVVEVYRSEVFHRIPFVVVNAATEIREEADGTARILPLCALLLDGHRVGSVLQVSDAAEASILDHTLMSFPYQLAPRRASVLLLGEMDGLNVWLALRRGATTVKAVQANGRVFQLLRQRLRSRGGAVFDQPGVEPVAMSPRHYVEHVAELFDLIQLVTLESSAAGSGGAGGLGQDHLVTVEGLEACLRRLSPDGLLSVCRGIQTPPRDNLRLLATLVAALRRVGVARPAECIVIVRDFQAVCTVAKPSSWNSREQVALIRSAVADRELTPVWFPGVELDELNQPDELPGPPGMAGDWYYHGARELFSPDAERFLDEWLFDLRPPTDDRPFFLDFCKLKSIGHLQRAFGHLWLTHAEIAFFFVLGATVSIGVVGAALTLVPLAFLRDVRKSRGKGSTAAYFAAIGLAYLLLEMTVLSRLTRVIGDPVQAASVTLCAFLMFSGLGSLVAQGLRQHHAPRVRKMLVAIATVSVAEILLLGELAGIAGGLSLTGRVVISIAVTAPMAFLMGFPMPTALAGLDRSARALIPWAWGVNGFASVLAAPLATVLAMTWGFRVPGLTAALLYLLGSWLFSRLPSPGSHTERHE